MWLFIILISLLLALLAYITACILINLEDTMQSGELIVVGENEVEIELHKGRRPDKTLVEFIDEPCWVPCNPETSDLLEWRVIVKKKNFLHKKKYFLVISWRVTGMRHIKFEVSF